jgi:arylsulfatase A-like enzyme
MTSSLQKRKNLRCAAIAGLGLCLAAASAAANASAKPNILIIFTDDQGYTDLGIHGIDPDVRTPNLDQLARDGVLFTRGYTTAPQCVPSRAGLITGRHQNAFGLDDNLGGPLSHDETTIAERLRDAGYVTGMSGKWHLDLVKEPGSERQTFSPAYGPHTHGFTEYFNGHLNHYEASHDLAGNPLPDAPQKITDTRYRIDVQTDAALSFLDRRAKDGKPWFLYLPYFAPHSPIEDPPQYMERLPHVKDKVRRMALASLLAMDDGVGRIREKIAGMDGTSNTLIFYISDNGAPLNRGAYVGSHNEPLIGEKGMQTDGGQRVPFIAAWPGKIPAGQVFKHPVWALDASATTLAAAGLPPDDKVEGVNLLPWLRDGKSGPVHEALFWRWRSQAAVLAGDWKFIRLGAKQRYLFDMREDGKETAADNLITKHPEIAADLERKLAAKADTWKTKGLPENPVAADQLFYDLHVERTLPPLPLGKGPIGAYIPSKPEAAESAD